MCMNCGAVHELRVHKHEFKRTIIDNLKLCNRVTDVCCCQMSAVCMCIIAMQDVKRMWALAGIYLYK